MKRLSLALIALLGAVPALHAATMDDVRTRLSSPFHQGLYSRTYRDILRRVEPSGYYQESLTGAYAGMFPRTVGGLTSLFLETGELGKAEAILGYVLRAIEVNGMERVPHVIDRERRQRDPVGDAGSLAQTQHTIALYRLDQPERFGGCQEFTAPREPVRAIELWLNGYQCEGTVTLEIAATLAGPAVARAKVDGKLLTPGGDWVRFEFAPAAKLGAGKHYVARASFSGKGVPAWFGLEHATGRTIGAAHGRDEQIKPGWLEIPVHAAAFAGDTGALRHVEREVLPILDDADQIDGQAHVIVSWARLAVRRGPTPFEDRTYPLVAKLMDRSTDWPYLTPYFANLPIAACMTGLVRNVCLEHSRDGRFWDTFDILTQSFICAALKDMARVAERRGDGAHALRWRGRLQGLQSAIAARMTRQLDGKTVYLEMRLPDGGGGVPFGGLGWLNLGPVAAQWEGVDRDVLRNTVAAYRKRAMFEAGGATAIATDWWPDRPLEKTVIGKGVGWEMAYSLREKEPERICQLLDAVEAINETPLYMESAGLGADGKWHAGDPGNGEQCSWWCWGMARARKAAGLPPQG